MATRNAAKLTLDMELRITVDGVSIPSTVRRMEHGSMSSCLDQCWQEFKTWRARDISEGRKPCNSLGSTYKNFNGQSVNIQIDIMGF